MSDDDHLHSIIADYGDACAEMQAEIDRLQLADKAKRFDDAVEAIDLKDKELIQERGVSRDLRKRVGELENKNSYNLQIVREATARISELEAERDVLHLFSGAQAAVIKEIREALELVLKYEYEWLVPSSLADVARAALAHSPRSLSPSPVSV